MATKRLLKAAPVPSPIPRHATIRLAAVIWSSGWHTCGPDIMQILDKYPFESENKSMITMYTESDWKVLQYINNGIKTSRVKESPSTIIDETVHGWLIWKRKVWQRLQVKRVLVYILRDK